MVPSIIDLFAGVGGLSLGFKEAGFRVSLANEFDPSIANSYRFNHPNTPLIVEDIATLPIRETFEQYRGKVSVVVGGPPCQGFSQKGMRRTINDERNYLFKYFVEVVKTVAPKYFVMENVPNLLTNHNGYFKRELHDLFQAAGYTVTSSVINAAEYGVPQNRRRAFVLGVRGNTAMEFPVSTPHRTTVWEAISDLSYLKSGEGEETATYKTRAETSYQESMRKDSSILYNHKATKHSAVALERMAMVPPNGDRTHLPAEHRTKSIYSGTWARMIQNDQSVTITTRFDTPASGRFTHPFLDRAITVREAARLQSFPDNFRFVGTKTSQMKQVGNAVPPLVARHLAEAVLSDMKNWENNGK